MIQEVKAFLGSDWKEFESLFARQLACDIPILNKVNKYLTERSGKQLRPALCLLAAHVATGGATEGSIRCAVASEMVHTATLLHDDVVDESDTRRGSPTVSSLISSRASVLVGDYWLSRGVMTLVSSCDVETFSDFATCIDDLSRGEMFQIEKAASLDTSHEDYIRIISCKTASLFRTAMRAGARNAGCTPAQRDAIDSFALHLGLAFQMRDDILDYSPQMSTGKPSGIDIKERKITLPLLGAFENAGADARARIVADVEAGRYDVVLPFVIDNKGLEYAQQVLERETRLAVDALAIFPDSPAKELLARLALSLCLREA